MARHPHSFTDEVATIDHQFDDHQPTMFRNDHRPVVRLDDPHPTIPPEPEDYEVEIEMPRALPSPERYAIERLLGQGAFGRVYAARDTKLGRPVALKVLHAQHAASYEIRQRFVQEAHAAACINHPGIVTVFDAGELPGSRSAYIAMELLAGESLHARLCRVGPLPSAKVRELARQIASTLDAAHRAGVIHRDLKPENIFLVPDPAATDGERVKVLDFGLAKPTLRASIQTHAATIFGTPAYMSPEQCESTRDIDHRSDIYALGCILFQLLVGKPPFDGTMRELIIQHRTAAPPKLPRTTDPELAILIRAMLAKDPAERPQSMGDIERALARPAATDGEKTRELPVLQRLPKLGIAVVALVSALGVCLSVV